MSKYTMIRVSRHTQTRLAAFRDKLFADYVAGIVELLDDQAEHVSFDYCINRLLNATLNHRQRAKAQRQERCHQTDGA